MAKVRTKSQNGRRSRAKGAEWEREVARLLVDIYPNVERNIAQARTARREGCDVEGTRWWIECKVGARPNLLAALRQARSDAGTDGRPPVVVAKPDRCPPVVVLDLETWCDLVLRLELRRVL